MKKFVGLLLSLIIVFSALAVGSFAVGYADTSVDISAIKDTYKIKTGIIGYPTVTTFIDDESQLNALSGAEKTPTTAFLHVSEKSDGLKVVDKFGREIADLYSCLKEVLGDKIIPAFYVNAGDTLTAQAVASFIETYSLKDCVLVSSDAQLLKDVRVYKDAGGFTRIRSISCMLDVLNAKGKSFVELSNLAVTAGARAVIVDIDDYSLEDFLKFRSDYTASALMVYLKLDGKTDVYRAIERGADGICLSDFNSAIEVYETFTERTVIRPITLQAHRGTDAINNENTLESVYHAALTGTSTIEIDPRLTKDKQIVLCHDPTIDRVSNGNGYVNDYTLAELKAMDVNVKSSAPKSKFCSLEEVFIMYENYGFTTPLALDAKETNPEYIQILYDLIDEYGMWNTVKTIGVADTTQLPLYREVFGDKFSFDVVKSITVQGLDESGKFYNGDVKQAIAHWLSSVNGASIPAGSVAPYYDCIVKSANKNAMPDVVRAMNDRGIKVSPYQFDKEAEMIEAFYLNLRNLSTGNAIYFSNFINHFKVDNVSVKKGDEFSVTGIAISLNGKETVEFANGFVFVDGDTGVISEDKGTIVANKNGQSRVMFYTKYNNGKVSYVRCSDIVTVTVGNGVRTANVSLSVLQNGETPWGLIAIISLSSLIVIGAGIMALVLILKRRKSNG